MMCGVDDKVYRAAYLFQYVVCDVTFFPRAFFLILFFISWIEKCTVRLVNILLLYISHVEHKME